MYDVIVLYIVNLCVCFFSFIEPLDEIPKGDDNNYINTLKKFIFNFY